MSTQPAVHGSGGLAARVADLRRRVKALEAAPTVITSLSGASIAPGSITTTEIAAGTITSANIAAGTITAANIAAGTITANQIQAGSITANEIAANTITAANIVAGTITATEIAAGAIQAQHIAADAITAGAISAGAITAGAIAAGAVTAGTIAADAVTTITIAAQAVTAGKIAAGAITAGTISANAITAGTIAAGAVTAGTVAADSITATEIASNTITANEITATTLQTLWTNSGLITGSTIRGARFVTSLTDTGSRVDIDSTGLKGYSAAGVQTFAISSGTGVFIAADPTSIIPGGALSAAQIGGGNMAANSSFEQGAPPGDATDHRMDGWQVTADPSSAPVTSPTYHGGNAYKIVGQSAGSPFWVGKRDTAIDRIPVVESRTYTVSAWIYTPTGTAARPFQFYMYWFPDNTTAGITNVISQSNGNNINGVPTTATVNSVVGKWTRFTYTATAPVGAKYAGFLVHAPNPVVVGETHYIDALQFEQGDVPTAYAPKGDEILYSSIRSEFIGAGQITANNIAAGAITAQQIQVAFAGSNRLTNSSFDDTSVGTGINIVLPSWTGLTNLTTQRIATTNRQGTGSSAKLTVTASAVASLSNSGNQVTVTPSQAYTFSGYVLNNTGAPAVAGRIEFYDAANALIGTATTGSTVTASPTWQRFTVTATAPSNAATARAYIYLPTPTAGNSIYADDMQLETGTTATAWGPTPFEILPGTIGPTTITPNSITTNQITTVNIDVQGIQAANIASGAITARTIAAGAVTTDKLTVGVIGTNLLASKADVDFERTDALALTGWTTSVTGTYVLANTGATATRQTAQFYAGASSMRVVTTGTNQGVGIQSIVGPTASGNLWKAGQPYTFSIYAYTPSNSVIDVLIGDAADANDYAQVLATHLSTTWQRITVTWTPTADRANAKLAIRLASGSTTFYLDNAQLEIGSQASMFSALGPDQITGTQILPGSIVTSLIAANTITADRLNMTIAGRNLLLNSAFAVGGAGALATANSWTAYTDQATPAPVLTQQGAGGPIGNGPNLKITADATATTGRQGLMQRSNEIRANSKYSVSLWAKSTNLRTLTIQVDWLDASAAVLSTSTANFTATGNYVRYSTDAGGAFSSPINAVSANVYFYFQNVPASEASNNIAYVKFEQSELATAWSQNIEPTVIDGSSITSAVYRTNSTTTRIQIDDTGGLQVYNGGVMTAQMKAGLGGLDLTSSTSSTSAPTYNKLRWLSAQSPGQIAVEQFAWDTTSNIVAVGQYAYSYTAGKISQSVIGASRPGGTSSQIASLSVTVDPSSTNSTRATVVAGTVVRDIMRADGTTDYILGSEGFIGNRVQRIVGGLTSITFSSSTASAVQTVAHGLGATPTGVFTSNPAFGFGGAISTYATNWTSTTFDFFGISNVSTTGSYFVSWLAFVAN